ncbi:hypothetical protein BS47DRAFT_1353602 [Hydnum rufescens UP504]|uniref:Uncharacterized protein n=1 Tax=Hydnum rufescens UP504 TaxID=1448309 RepID=A0A9P6DJY2_9AGAM|nr:hypothetical protein BS47DRAFT_1353602 [Hydnum rufescens UP504]
MASPDLGETIAFPHTEIKQVGDMSDIPGIDLETRANVTAVDHDGPVVTRSELWSYYLYVRATSHSGL